eukprot:g6955.t1
MAPKRGRKRAALVDDDSEEAGAHAKQIKGEEKAPGATQAADGPAGAAGGELPPPAGGEDGSASSSCRSAKGAKKETLLPPEDEDEARQRVVKQVQFSQELVEEILDPVTGLPVEPERDGVGQPPGSTNEMSWMKNDGAAVEINASSSKMSPRGDASAPAPSSSCSSAPAPGRTQAEAEGGSSTGPALPAPTSTTGAAATAASSGSTSSAPPPPNVVKRSQSGEQSSKINTNATTGAASSSSVGSQLVQMSEKDAGKKPRLMIREIHCENFKSYGGVRKMGPFHQNFSAVIGANGSGKSNTIDALQFAFGKRAKAIRQNKLSELIHNSNAMPDCKHCSVTVFMQDIIDIPDPNKEGQQYTVVEGSQIELKRTARHNNVNFYQLDGEKADFEKVQAVLVQRGIDLKHNRFLIAQGEVEQISLMKPKAKDGGSNSDEGFLEYLEEIIGSNQYVEAINKRKGDLERVNEERTSKLNILRIAERAKDHTKKEADEAMRYVQAMKDWLICKATVEQANLWQAKGEEAELAHHVEESQKAVEELRGKAKEQEQKLQEWRETNKALFEAHAEAKARGEKIREEFLKLEEQEQDIKAEQADIEATTAAMQKKQQDAKAAQEEIKKKAQKTETEEIPKKQQELNSHKTMHGANERKLEEMEQGVSVQRNELLKEKERLEPVVSEFHLKKKQKEQEMASLHQEKTRIAAKQISYEKELHDLKAQISNVDATIQTEEAVLADENRRIADTQPLLDECERDAPQEQAKLKSLESDAWAKHDQWHRANLAINTLGHANKTQQMLKDAGKKGRFKLYGRVGDIADIDKRYDVAATMCIGKQAFNNLVVESMDDATKVLNFARENDLGRVVCIVRQKVATKYEKKLWEQPLQKPGTHKNGQMPEYSRIYDLIKLKKGFSNDLYVCIYECFREALVCDTVDNAKKLQHEVCPNTGKKNRVVTLAGDILEGNGNMTGGGTQAPLSGGFQTQTCEFSHQQRDELYRRYEKAEADWKAQREYVAGLLSAGEATKRDVDGMRSRAEAAKEQIATYKARKSLYLQRLAAREASGGAAALSAQEKKQLEQCDEQIRAKTNEIGAIDADAHEVLQKCQQLDFDIAHVGGEDYAKLQKAADKSKKEVAALQKQLAQLDSDLALWKTKLAEEEKNEEDAKAEEKTCEEKRVEAERKTQELLDSADAFDREFKVVTEKVHALAAEIEKRGQDQPMVDALKKVKDLIVDTERALDDFKTKHRAKIMSRQDFEEKLAGQRKEFGELPNWELEEEVDEFGNLVGVEEGQSWMKVQGADQKAGKNGQKTNQFDRRHAISADFTDEECRQIVETREDTVAKLLLAETRLKKFNKTGKPSLAVIDEYKDKLGVWKKRTDEYEKVHEEREVIRTEWEELKERRKKEFMAGYKTISLKLKEMYQMITLGGDAELELVDNFDPFAEGINFSVRPPKKSWKQITNLSGGEKTLASLSLVFALHHYRPTPLYFMDEIDAALDFRNVSIIGQYIKQNTKNAQFIIISLRNHMFELANLLVGVCKKNDVSHTVYLDPEKGAAAGPGNTVRRAVLKDRQADGETLKKKDGAGGGRGGKKRSAAAAE